MSIKLIVGLQNPGQTYQKTRHNAGAWFVEALAHAHHASLKSEKKRHASLAEVTLPGASLICMLPDTYMNHSGLAVRAVAQFYQISPENILVAHDELDLPTGRIKLKSGGGHGGHNGLRDIMAQLGSPHFHRLRIGIGHPGHKDLVLNYVLGKPSDEDKQSILQAIDKAMLSLPALATGSMAQAMNLLNA